MIDATAFVHKDAKLGKNVSVGYNAYIDAHVEIGEGTIIKPFAMITGHTKIGKFNKIFSYVSLGEAPQDVSYQDEPTRLEIGDHNIFREGVTVHRATQKGGGLTKIGDHNFFLAYSHVGHDCHIGNHNTIVNFVGLSGHVEIGDYVLLSAYSGIHQFTRIGSYAMIAHAAMVSQDVPSFILVAGGDSPHTVGLNTTGLKRRGFSETDITWLKRLYKIYYKSGLTQEAAIEAIKNDILPHCPKAEMFLDFVAGSKRGVLRK
jgi:UDP-N-acetylglucosamine acyltransferase